MIFTFNSRGRVGTVARHNGCRLSRYVAPIVICGCLTMALPTVSVEAQSKKVRVALPGYTIAALSFLAAKMNNYYIAEGLDVELIAMRAPTANLAVLSGSVEFSGVPLAGLTTALRGGGVKLLFCQFDKPQHALFAKPEFQNVKALRGKNSQSPVSAPSTIFCCVKFLAPTGSIPRGT